MAELDEDLVRAVLADRSTALVDGDADRMRQLLADDFTYTNAAGGRCGREEYVDFYLSSPDVIWHGQARSNEEIRVYGAAAVATLDVHDRASFGGHPMDGDYRSLFVLVKTDGVWRVVAAQTTALRSDHAAGDDTSDS